VLVAIVLGGLGACASPAAQPEPAPGVSSDHASGGTDHGAKVSAPVTVALRQEAGAASGELVLVLTVTATGAVPQAVARFALPEEAKVLEGRTTVDLGALSAGQRVEARVRVVRPAGGFTVAAGVDCLMSVGVQLHASASLEVGGGSAPVDRTTVIKDADGGGVRMERLR